MKERPILFSAPMIRALLSGTKTQTRRIVKLPAWAEACNEDHDFELDGTPEWPHAIARKTGCMAPPECPYGEPGDRLWVKESARCIAQSTNHARDETRLDVDYRAAGGASFNFPIADTPKWFPKLYRNADGSPRWQPSIHMPRWASRILLEVTEVRVQQLQEISEEDARAEGLSQGVGCWWNAGDEHFASPTPIGAYAHLWQSINGPGSWGANPWVWAITFRRVNP